MDGKIWFKRGLPLFLLRDDIASWQRKSSVRRCQLTLQPSVPSCPSWDALQTNKRVEKAKSQGGQRVLAGDTNLDWTRIQGKDWTNIKPELSNTGSAGLHSLPFTVEKKKKKGGRACSQSPPTVPVERGGETAWDALCKWARPTAAAHPGCGPFLD